jgi:hypothetical protein
VRRRPAVRAGVAGKTHVAWALFGATHFAALQLTCLFFARSQCYKQFARYSQRFLRALVEELDTFSDEFFSSGFWNDEFWAPTVCKGQLARKHMGEQNCTLRGLVSYAPSIFDESFSCCAAARYHDERSFGYAMDHPSKMFHPAKF